METPVTEKTFVWKHKSLRTMREIFDEALKCKDKEEAAEFLKAYVALGVSEDIAKQNLGYMAGYYNQKTVDKVYELFGAVHPVFGRVLPGPEEAFSMGVKMGEEWKKEKDAKG